MRNSLICAFACAFLAGCISTEPTQSQLEANEKRCRAFGYAAGTKGHADCQMQLAYATAQSNEATKARANAMFRGMAGAGYSQPSPQFSPVYTGPQQTVYPLPQPTLSQTVNSTMRAQRY